MKHRHHDVPTETEDSNGNPIWRCDNCGRTITLRLDLPPVDISAAHVIADIRGSGLRSDVRQSRTYETPS